MRYNPKAKLDQNQVTTVRPHPNPGHIYYNKFTDKEARPQIIESQKKVAKMPPKIQDFFRREVPYRSNDTEQARQHYSKTTLKRRLKKHG